MFFYKDGNCITVEQGFRWATFTVESVERPLSDEELKNEHGYELGWIDNDECWELQDMIDGCWLDISADDDVPAEELEKFEAAWEEDGYSGVEDLGWSNDDTEYYYYGPLELTNQDTGAVYQGKPDEPQEKTEQQLKQELDELIAAMPEAPEQDDEPEVTDWYPVATNPVRIGRYQVTDHEETNWPFPQYATWNGKTWDHAGILSWRGLASNPAK